MKKIGIIGTRATIKSHSYKKIIESTDPEISVIEQDCPLFVPLVENGFISKDDQIVRLVIKRYLSPLMEEGVDTVILGCTHYPIIKEAISSVMGENVALIDSGRETAIYAKKILSENNLLNESKEKGNAQFYVSDTPDGFENIIGIQELDGEKDKIEMTTTGSYINKNGHSYIGYKEYDEDDPNISSNNVIKVEDNSRVTIIRNSGKQTRLILEKGKRHQCHYRTIMGDLMIGVFADIINADLDDNGGKLHVKYSLDFNNDFISNNEFYIDIKAKNEG